MSFAMAEEVVNEVAEVAENAANGRLKLDIGGNLLDAVLGYLVVFIGLFLLMCVVVIVGKVMTAKKAAPAAEVSAPIPAAATAPAAPKMLAPGSAGDVKIYDTDPRDAAMIMQDEAEWMYGKLRYIGFPIKSPTDSYFFFTSVKSLGVSAQVFARTMLENGIMVRDCSSFGPEFSNYVRFCVKDREHNVRFMEALERTLKALRR